MEIEIKTNFNSKKIKLENSIISLQSNDNSVIKHLINDYKPIVIDNTNLFFIGKTVLDEISSYTSYPELDTCYETLKILELYNTFMDKETDKLSTTEKIYLNILRNVSKTNDIIVFTIAMITMEATGISTKYNKYSHLIGGIIMVIIGILLIFKPGWLMFTFK